MSYTPDKMQREELSVGLGIDPSRLPIMLMFARSGGVEMLLKAYPIELDRDDAWMITDLANYEENDGTGSYPPTLTPPPQPSAQPARVDDVFSNDISLRHLH